MPRYQVAFRAAPYLTAVVQTYGDALPANHINIGSFYHDHDGQPDHEGKPGTHVLYNHVRDLLYKRKPDGTANGVFPNNFTDMGRVIMSLDAVYVAVTGISSLPATVSLANGATQQITNTISPGGASNTAVTYSTSNAAVATVSASGLITAGATDGSATITVTTVDGAFTDTVVVTVA